MAPTDAGRHCAACQTQVVDFTRMTEGEVVAFLSQYHPVRRCGRFREDQVGRPLLAAAQPITGWRRWAVATVLLLGSAFGMRARAQGTKPGLNERAMAPAATNPTHAAIPDSMFLVRGVVRNWWGVRQQGAQARVVKIAGGLLTDSTDARGWFSIVIPKRKFKVLRYVTATYRKPSYGRNYLSGREVFDSTRTKPYHIRMHKVINHNPGFF